MDNLIHLSIFAFVPHLFQYIFLKCSFANDRGRGVRIPFIRGLPDSANGSAIIETLEEIRLISRTLASLSNEDDRLVFAASFGYSMVSAWWDALTDGKDAAALREPFKHVRFKNIPRSDQALAARIGEAAAALEPDEAAYQLGLVYTGMLPNHYRSRFGIYYTPPALARQLISRATDAGVDWTTARILDPACGGGAFLAPVALRILRELFLGPVHVYRMTIRQAGRSSDADRAAYASGVLRRGFHAPSVRWYADNTREPIRDETLRDGLVAVGAVERRNDLPTTSGLPRYALKREFAALFDPALLGEDLRSAISRFQTKHLSKSALARIAIIRAGAAATDSTVLVTFPNGETRQLAPGPSSVIAKAVIEVFAPRFLEKAAVLWLSESGNKIVMRDDRIANAIGLRIEADEDLPDLILADLGTADPLIVFVEVVATDGAITPRRQEAIYRLTDAAGFQRNQIAFVTAYLERESAGFRRTVAQLAWQSFAWFASEPESIVILRDGSPTQKRLADLVGP